MTLCYPCIYEHEIYIAQYTYAVSPLTANLSLDINPKNCSTLNMLTLNYENSTTPVAYMCYHDECNSDSIATVNFQSLCINDYYTGDIKNDSMEEDAVAVIPFLMEDMTYRYRNLTDNDIAICSSDLMWTSGIEPGRISAMYGGGE